MTEQPLVLIDVFNLSWRSHWAFENLSHEGQPTGVFYGFLKAVQTLRKEVSKRLLFCWDNGIPTGGTHRPIRSWRADVFPGYKSGRIPVVPDKVPQGPIVLNQLSILGKSVIKALGYDSVGYPGLEADDIISLYACYCSLKVPVRIFSSDRDFYQLLDSNTEILTPKKANGQYQTISEQDLVRDFELKPDQWAAYLAMGGDNSDSIKPARGMGPATAKKLIAMGADPSKPWDSQPHKVHNKIVDPEVWDRCRRAYQVARLPRNCSELPKVFRTQVQPPFLPQVPEHSEAGLKQFTTFCADYGLHDFFAARREFFG